MGNQDDRRHFSYNDPVDARIDYERDRDRVLYSPEFRRLAGITQVAAIHEQHLLHNRLTHSLKVAQMGRRISERLNRRSSHLIPNGALIPDVVEVAGLAHDLGHPPFGHSAERVLDNLAVNKCGGFEGNAQSFRIVTKVSTPKIDSSGRSVLGLNLTRASLNSILKYPRYRSRDKVVVDPWTDRSRGKKWGVYREEAEDFSFARDCSASPSGVLDDTSVIRSPNSIVMDWADDISYATHDLEDYIEAGIIMPERLNAAKEEFSRYAYDRMKDMPGFNTSKFGLALESVLLRWDWAEPPFNGTRNDQSRLRGAITQWIRRFNQGCYAIASYPYVEVDESVQYEAEILKKITDFYVVDLPGLRADEHGSAQIVGELFDFLANWLTQKDLRGIPKGLLDLHALCRGEHGSLTGDSSSSSDPVIVRAVVDYICTLTENQAIDMHQRMTGSSQASAFGAWFR